VGADAGRVIVRDLDHQQREVMSPCNRGEIATVRQLTTALAHREIPPPDLRELRGVCVGPHHREGAAAFVIIAVVPAPCQNARCKRVLPRGFLGHPLGSARLQGWSAVIRLVA
jgi:hypothetical protein